MRRLLVWFDNLSSHIRLLLSALGTAIPFYFAALLSHLVSEYAKLNQSLIIALHAVIFIVLFTVIIFITRYARIVRDALKSEDDERRAALLHAYAFVDRVKTRQFEDLCNHTPIEDRFVASFVTSLQQIQRIVDAAYNTFESAFGKTLGIDRTDFQVTFMTKSYIDGKITIPACANREGRAPRSMVLRKTTPDIYDHTITAVVYREARPTIHIVGDTTTEDYHALYPEEKEESRSSIIFPVLSDKNELLGTLVVYCDKPNFFTRQHYKYWNDLLEVFAKRVALNKAKMDLLVSLKQGNASAISVNLPDFGF